jgi:hypothetical protein
MLVNIVTFVTYMSVKIITCVTDMLVNIVTFVIYMSVKIITCVTDMPVNIVIFVTYMSELLPVLPICNQNRVLSC